jgi:LytS/YehU family sensor histidine kinase
VTERTGLGNLRQRLRTTYGGRASMHLDRLDAGARVVVRIPVQEAECAS